MPTVGDAGQPVLSEAVAEDSPPTAAPLSVRLPPAPRIPKALQFIAFAVSRRRTMQQLARRYDRAFTLDLSVIGRTVVVTDPELAKQVFMTSPEDLGNIQPNLSRMLGSRSMFALDGAEHSRRRRLLSPSFHGKNVKNYEQIFEEETLRETATWPEGKEFSVFPSMTRIALNAILRAIFGAGGVELDQLRRLIPPWVTLFSRLESWPLPQRTYGRYTPWGRLVEWRRQYEVIVDKLIENELADPNFEDRTDVLAVMLRGSYEDGSVMSRKEISDELIGLLAAGHETTAATMSWVFERLSRHPAILSALVEEAEEGGKELRRATIAEVQRTRTVIEFAGRHVYAPTVEVGEWVIPQGYSIVINISQIHANAEAFPDPDRFDPQRYIGTRRLTDAWVAYGGGTRRCPGATFANVEMDVILRTVLRHFTIDTTTAPGEKWHARGVAFTPKDGGKIVVHRRH